MADSAAAIAELDKVQKFFDAAREGNVDLFKSLAAKLSEGGDLSKTVADVKDANRRGALHFAAREGRTELCRFLLKDLDLDVDVEDDDGDTPLIHAARQGQTVTAKYLLEHGANPVIHGTMGATAMHHSAGRGDVELLRILLSQDVEIESQSDAGTPLIWASGHAQKDSVDVLLKHGANPNAETEDDITPLLSSVAAGSFACIELLVKAGASVNITAGGTTPLHIASDNGNPDIINCLLNAGADPNAIDDEGQKPIQVAAAIGNREAVEILFPLTSQVQTIPKWTIEGIFEWVRSEAGRQEEETRSVDGIAESASIAKKNYPEVNPKAKKMAAEAKARGDDAFKTKDYLLAIEAYTQAIEFDPGDATLFSNRSLCWMRMGHADHALSDAKECRSLRPDWSKGCYREGAALRLLQIFDEAANAFYEGVKLDPENVDLVNAFRGAVEAGRKIHDADKQTNVVSR